MVSGNEPVTERHGKEFVITRLFDAPRDLVWKALTEPDRLALWWGPKGFTVTRADVDLRPGGVFFYGLRSPDGWEMWGKWLYREVVPPERLVTISSFADSDGNQVRHPMDPSWPLEMLSTLTLSDQGGKTLVTVTSAAYNATDDERATFESGFGSMEEGFAGTFDKLADYLADAQTAEGNRE